MLYRIIKDNLHSNSISQVSTLVVGDSSSSENFIRHTKTDKNSPYKIIAIISVKAKSVGRRIHNIPIVGSLENFKNIKFNILSKLKRQPEELLFLTIILIRIPLKTCLFLQKITVWQLVK